MPVANAGHHRTTSTTTTTTTTSRAMSRCPHVVLMGECSPPPPPLKYDDEDEEEIKCDDCGSKKHLWACLRADCGYVGCGGETNRHSTLHAVRMHHPLAVNLNTRLVWCELCESRVVMEKNDPKPVVSVNACLSSRQQIAHSNDNDKDDQRDPSLDDAGAHAYDDFDIVNYLYQDNTRESNSSEESKKDDSTENRSGQVGLDNLGNTCYMNAALQCLSNIEALTSFFLECSHYIKATTAHRQQQSSRGNASGSQLTQQSLAMTYVRLMKDIWQRPSKASSKQLVSSVAPVDLIRVIKLAQPMFRGCQQHDSMELLTYLLDQMHEELKRPLPPVAAIRPPKSPLASSSSRLHSFPIDNEENEWDENEEGREEVEDEELEEEEMRRQNGTESEENDEVEEEKEERDEDEESEDNLTLVKRHHHNDLTKHSCNAQNGHSDLDSGISSVTNGSSSADHTEKGLSRMMLPTDAVSISASPSVSATASSSGCSEDAQSIDSYVTCGDDQASIATTAAAANLNMTASDYSLHYSDADESLTPPSASTMSSSSYLASSHSQHDVSPTAAATATNGTFTRSKSFIPFKQSKKRSRASLSHKKRSQEQHEKQQESTTSATTNHRTTYTSIVSELFEGSLISQVQCLECEHISTTTESFLHLSLPIPSKDYLHTLHSRLVAKQQLSQAAAANNNENKGWLSWIVDTMKGFVWSQTIKLTDCLTAFFSDDDLKDDNMYSCDKCKKLTNGIKYSKILNLPEVLIVHLKRFRHDSMFSAGKINSYISFPIDNLNMQPFVHKDCKNEITQYDLCSVICHYGSANGGHYTAFGRNYLNEEWYEYDDSYCRQVDSLTLQNTQAYVLFYKKKSIKTDTIKEELRSIFAERSGGSEGGMMSAHYISKLWLHKLKYFGEPGPIDQSSYLCAHKLVESHQWRHIDSLVLTCTSDTWSYLSEAFGVRCNNDGVCTRLYPCAECQRYEEALRQRQYREKFEFIRLREKWNQQQLSVDPETASQPPQRVFAISIAWFRLWEQFVQQQQQQPASSIPIPPEIDNLTICLKPPTPSTNSSIPTSKKRQKQLREHHFNPKSKHYKISEEMWSYLQGIYGGGPSLEINNNHTTYLNQNGCSSSSKSLKSIAAAANSQDTNANNQDRSQQT